MIIEMIAGLLVFLMGLYFLKTKNPEKAVLLIAGNYSGLDTMKICRTVGKRLELLTLCFAVGVIIAFFNGKVSYILSFGLFTVGVIIHIIDFCLNMKKRYKVETK